MPFGCQITDENQKVTSLEGTRLSRKLPHSYDGSYRLMHLADREPETETIAAGQNICKARLMGACSQLLISWCTYVQ